MTKQQRRAGTTRRPRCRICERAVYVPPGWSGGAAVRRHYWRKHPEVMMARRKAGR